jgi:hypothetical protein
VFFITDNSSFEGASYKGHSSSRELMDVVFWVHKAQQDGRFVLHTIHISDKGMKALGGNGLSRGDLTEGMMAGQDPLLFVPFNKGANDRSGGWVSAWVRSWWSSKKGSGIVYTSQKPLLGPVSKSDHFWDRRVWGHRK